MHEGQLPLLPLYRIWKACDSSSLDAQRCNKVVESAGMKNERARHKNNLSTLRSEWNDEVGREWRMWGGSLPGSTHDFHTVEAQVHMLTADVPTRAASGDTDLERDDLTRRQLPSEYTALHVCVCMCMNFHFQN